MVDEKYWDNDEPKRSIEAHNTEWLYYQIIADETGNDAYQIYEMMCARHLKVLNHDGDLYVRKPTSLNRHEHYLYLQRVIVTAAEFNIWLPDPEKAPERKYNLKKLSK